MPMNRKLLGAAAFSLALAGGGAAGALLGTPNLTLAQDGETETTTESAPADDAGRPGFGHHGGEQLSVAAEAIGITEEELRAALEDGQTIAEVATANGVEVERGLGLQARELRADGVGVRNVRPGRRRAGLGEHLRCYGDVPGLG